MFGSLSYFRFDVENPTANGEAIDGPRVGGVGNAGHSWGYNGRVSAGANYIFSPTLLMDGFFGWTRQNTNVEQRGIGTNTPVQPRTQAEFLNLQRSCAQPKFRMVRSSQIEAVLLGRLHVDSVDL